MSRTPEEQKIEACEIIELAIDELELLTRAFTVIEEVCEHMNSPRPALLESAEKIVLN